MRPRTAALERDELPGLREAVREAPRVAQGQPGGEGAPGRGGRGVQEHGVLGGSEQRVVAVKRRGLKFPLGPVPCDDGAC